LLTEPSACKLSVLGIIFELISAANIKLSSAPSPIVILPSEVIFPVACILPVTFTLPIDSTVPVPLGSNIILVLPDLVDIVLSVA